MLAQASKTKWNAPDEFGFPFAVGLGRPVAMGREAAYEALGAATPTRAAAQSTLIRWLSRPKEIECRHRYRAYGTESSRTATTGGAASARLETQSVLARATE